MCIDSVPGTESNHYGSVNLHSELFNTLIMSKHTIETLNGEHLVPTRYTADEIATYMRTPNFTQDCGMTPVDPDTHQCQNLKNAQATCRYQFARAFDVVELNLCMISICDKTKRSSSFEKPKSDEAWPGVNSTEDGE